MPSPRKNNFHQYCKQTMRLRADQLPTHLKKSGLAPIYLISGDEPLQIMEAADQIRHYARENGHDERAVLTVNKGFDWNQLHHTGSNLSLFSSKRLIELRLDDQNPGKEGAAALIEYVEKPDPDNTLMILAHKLDKRTQQSRWYKTLDKTGVTMPVWPVEPAKLPDWIMQRMRGQGKTVQRDTATLIAQRVEGNLLAAKQELDKLCLLFDKPDISSQDVINSVIDSARFDVFSLIDCAFLGNIERTTRMLQGLQYEGVEPISIFGAIMWEFRKTCIIAHEISTGVPKEKVFSANHVWPQKKTGINAILSRYNVLQLAGLLRDACMIDKVIKGAVKADVWNEIEKFMFRIAGVKLQSSVNH